MQAVCLTEVLSREIERMQGDVIALIKELCAIPAPSHHEERRAAFIRDWFLQRGMRSTIDEAQNVLCPMGLDEHEDIVVIAAHTDTVFPDLTPMPLREEGDRLYCPGVGDDTANLAAMMLMASLLKERKPRCGVLFVANSCEEGLGNLKGSREVMRAYGPRVKAFVSLDGGTDDIVSRAVGSFRYRITARTKGGHSFSDFGERNAIAVLAELISGLYAQRLPQKEGAITTYNVGTIAGGTSVNAIAQQAEMLYEFRSDDASCLRTMEEQLRVILRAHTPQDATLDVELIGERPCAERVEPGAQRALEAACADALRRYAGTEPALLSGSTDCNIPLSMGVPSACFGVYRGEGAHTREEWIDVPSLCGGMKAAMSVLLNWFE